jgi:BlaI family penicillinase repressor
MTDYQCDGFNLGPLETEIMRLVWDMGEVQVDEIHKVLQTKRPIAYTTVMTVMTRLTARRLLERRKVGRAYFYQAAVSRQQLAGNTLRELVQRFWGTERIMPAVSFLLGSEKLSPEDLVALRKLVDKMSREDGNK